MKIKELNRESSSLSSIAVEFSELSSIELEHLVKMLARLPHKIQLNESKMVAFFTIFDLENLIKSWGEQAVEVKKIFDRHRIIWAGKHFSFDLTTHSIVYSIINVTPDSFYDGAQKHLDLSYILKRVEADLEAGADVIELGGKSSRPGYSDITPEEEWLRLETALKEIRKTFKQAVIAVDTDEAYVMERALAYGVDVINDIDGFDTEEKLKIIGREQPALVVMNNGRAGFHFADNVYEELPEFFAQKQEELLSLGLKKERLSIDAGVGFLGGPTGADSVMRVKSTEILSRLGLPIMIAISRKSFMENVFAYPKEERLLPTLLFEKQMMAEGGRILRVHDVKETKQMIDSFELYQKF